MLWRRPWPRSPDHNAKRSCRPHRPCASWPGPGSGKTRVLTLRVARRIQDGSADADHTAVCTFTRKAAHELEERLGTYGVPVSSPASAGRAPGPGVRAGTLHQLALTLLRRHALDAGRASPGGGRAPVPDHPGPGRRPGHGVGGRNRDRLGQGPVPLAPTGTWRPRPSPAGPRWWMPTGSPPLFADYDRALLRRRSLDLDDVLVRSGDLLLGDSRFRRAHALALPTSLGRRVPGRESGPVPPHPGADGVHDAICVPWETPTRPSTAGTGPTRPCSTGCPRPSPTWQVVRLDENHRSTPQVVAAATAGLGRAVTVPPRSLAGDGPMPVVTAFDDETAEAEGIVSSILERAEDGMLFSDQAVLARTHDQLAQIGRALDRAGVPYRVAPGPESPAGESAGVHGAGNGVPGPLRAAGQTSRTTAGRGDGPTSAGTLLTPSSWRPSTGQRASSGPRCTWWVSRTDSFPSSMPPPRRPATRSADCSTWRSPERRGSSTVRGSGFGVWATAGRWSASHRRGWRRWPECREPEAVGSPRGMPADASPRCELRSAGDGRAGPPR